MGKLDFDIISKGVSGFIVVVCTLAFGGTDRMLISLIMLLVIDYLTGMAAAFIHKELSSKKGFRGILKKVLFLAVVAVANIIDNYLHFSGTIRNVVIGFLMANEGLSILENCTDCGLPIPKKLIETLKQLKDSANSKDPNEKNDDGGN